MNERRLRFRVVPMQSSCCLVRSRNAAPRDDWIVDLGPEGGDKGAQIVASGTPEEVAEHPTSHTGRYLKQMLEQHPPQVAAG